MDGQLVFEGKGRPIGSVSIFTLYCKMGRGRLQMKINAGSIPMATFSQLLFNPFGKCCGTAGPILEQRVKRE
jgi:hypothetical protein